jgi:hypothetical protein
MLLEKRRLFNTATELSLADLILARALIFCCGLAKDSYSKTFGNLAGFGRQAFSENQQLMQKNAMYIAYGHISDG